MRGENGGSREKKEEGGRGREEAKRGDRETSEERDREQMSEVGEGKWEEEKEVGAGEIGG